MLTECLVDKKGAEGYLSKRIVVHPWPEGLDMMRVCQYALDMNNGDWDTKRKDHPIIISEDGVPLEGLHRLTAIRMLEKPVSVVVFLKGRKT